MNEKTHLENLAGLLETDDPAEQLARIESLLAPVVTITIQMDFRTGTPTVSANPTANYEMIYDILAAGREAVRQREISDRQAAERQAAGNGADDKKTDRGKRRRVKAAGQAGGDDGQEQRPERPEPMAPGTAIV